MGESSFFNVSFYISIALIIFTIIYGTRNVDASEKHPGLIAVVAFESIIKLLVFIVIGIFVCFWVFPSSWDIFERAKPMVGSSPKLFQNLELGVQPIQWFIFVIISALAMLMLPRQFQVAVAENNDERHIDKATWLFPLYLFAINLFVLPIAFAGKLYFDSSVDADTYLLAFPMAVGADWLVLLVLVGGISAATGMVIMETIALTTMISNSIIIPAVLKGTTQVNPGDHGFYTGVIKNSRRISIVVILAFAFLYENTVGANTSLVSIGMISFAAVAQVAPALLGGLYWKHANRKAATASILTGFSVWAFTLILPSLQHASPVLLWVVENGPWGIEWLKPTALFGFADLDPLSHGVFWSMLCNLMVFISVSIYTQRSESEVLQAELFVDVYLHSNDNGEKSGRRGNTKLGEIRRLLSMFLGQNRSDSLINGYANRHKIALDTEVADFRIVTFVERILSGVIGSSSARMMMGTVNKDEKISFNEIYDLAKESQQFIHLNKELRKKSNDLMKATEELQQANERLKRMDEVKDEFLYTVTHELRTPLTAIRALSEVLYDNPDMDDEAKQHYLDSVITETERMTHLITQVLNLERYESGRQRLNLSSFDMPEMVKQEAKRLNTLAAEKKIQLSISCPDSMLLVRADKDLMGQVLYNLISNGLKYAKSLVKVQVIAQGNDLVVSVIDDGPGVPKEHRKLIFDKFYQVKHRHLQKPAGSGLGLAISKRVMEMHEGDIWVTDGPNRKGAKFCFSLQMFDV